MNTQKTDLLKHYKKVFQCQKCNNWYGSDQTSNKIQFRYCPECTYKRLYCSNCGSHLIKQEQADGELCQDCNLPDGDKTI